MSSHSHTFDGAWPFVDSEHAMAFCCEHVFQHESPILRVAHDHDGDWQFLCGGGHEGSQPRVICLGCALQRDGTLVAVADLPIGWAAERDRPGARWEPLAMPEDESESA